MAKKLVNLTFRYLNKELEEALTNYPTYPYQVALLDLQLRQQLIDRVLTQIPNYYTIIEDTEQLPEDVSFIYASLEEQVRIATLIRQNIIHTIHDRFDSELLADISETQSFN